MFSRQIIRRVEEVLPRDLIFILLVVMNCFDGILTMSFLNFVEFNEKNPLMGFLIDNDPLSFAIYKFGVTNILVLGVWYFRNITGTVLLTSIVCLLYSGVVLYWMILVI